MEETVQQRIASHERHRGGIVEAASALIGIADDLGISLVDIIATMEQHIVQNTKVGDATGTTVPEGRIGYTLNSEGRLEEWRGGQEYYYCFCRCGSGLHPQRSSRAPLSDASAMATKSSTPSLVEKRDAVQASLTKPRIVLYKCVAKNCPGHTGAYADEDCS